MRKLLSIILVVCCFAQHITAQNATFSVPVSIGVNNCGSGLDSVYYFNYTSPALINGAGYTGCRPVLKTNYAPLNTYSSSNRPFTAFNASIAFNPGDQMIYYIWTDYNVAPPYKSYIWRWPPTACPTSSSGGGLDTVRTFNTDIGGITFDANGIAYQLEFNATAPYKAFLRTVDFTTGVVGPRDTLDLTGGKQLWNVGTGDITLTPSGQMYFVFNNKLFTPDYGSYNGPTHHIKCTYIDTIRAPGGTSGLPGLAFGNGDLIAAYSPGCVYRRINGVTGDTAAITYTYAAAKGVRSTDMTQINSGLGLSKKLVSITPVTGSQYQVVYDIYVRNYGNVPITNVQVTDDLAQINGLLNVSDVSAILTSNPAGVALSGGYTGTLLGTNLMAAGQTLPCYPVANNNFTIRITCKINGINPGTVYYNSARGTASGYRNVALRDSSTNGSNPDLNQNDKPDDVGESEPTPFVIILTPTTPPCATLAQTLYNQTFGTGTGMTNSMVNGSVTASSAYGGVTTAPVPVNRFTVTNNANNGNTTDWISLTDHTTGTGRMLLVNADAPASVMYRDTLPVSCPGQQYSVSFWTAFIGNAAYQVVCDGLGGFKYPKLTVRIRDYTTGLTITQFTTNDIMATNWQQLGMKWVMPTGYTSVILEFVNSGPGGCGNDLAIDDIQYGICDPVPTVSLNNPLACVGGSITFTANLSDPAVIPGTKDYQWQWSPAPGTGPWTNILLSNAVNYTINPVVAADTGRYYRVIVAAQGNLANITCQYISPGVRLGAVAPSTAPSNISVPATTICNGTTTTLTAVGAVLGTGANYQWGTGGTIGANPIAGATGSTLPVTPATTTTYWVRVENTASPCLSATGGATVTITVNQPSTAPANITGPDLCNGTSTTLTANGGVLGTGANYQWGTGGVVGTSPLAGATNPTLTVSPTVNTTYWVRIQNTTAPCAATTGGVTKLVTVRQPSTAPSSISVPSTTICSGSSTTLTSVGGVLGTGANYQWGTGSVVGTDPVAGATSPTFIVSPTTTTTYWVRIENTTAPCTATTSGATVTVIVNQPSIAPTSITGPDICNGMSTTLTANGGNLGTGANYQWGTGTVVGTSPLAGETNPTLTVSPTVNTTYWVRIQNTTAPCAANTGGVTKLVTVRQPSTAPSSISAPSTTFCNTASTTLTAVGGILGTGATYQWGTGAVIGVNPIAGATAATLAISGVTTTTTYWVRIENTTSPCTALTGGTTATITINQSSIAPTSITGPDICNGMSTTLTANGGNLGTGANYQWGTGTVVGTSPLAGETNPTLTVSPTANTTYWVRIQNTTTPCAANTGGVTKLVTVRQPSTAPSSISAPSTTLCSGSSTTLTAVGGALGTGANYQWGTGPVVGVNPIAGATGTTLAVTGLTSTTTYWVRIENTTSPCTALTGGAIVTITVNQPSTAPTSIAGPDICSGTSTTLTANGGNLGTGANYQWGTGTVVGTSPLAGETNPTLTVSPIVNTTYWVRIQNTSAPCAANTGGVTKLVTVRQPSTAPTSISAPSTAVCLGTPITLTATGGSLGTGANYQWGTGAVVGVNPIAGATGTTLVVSPIVPTTYWVRVENTTAPCSAITGGVTTTITINQPSTGPSSISGPDICNGASTTLTAFGATLGTNANYQWGTGTVVGVNPIPGATNSTLTVSPTTTTTYWVRVENTAGPCAATTSGVTKLITVGQLSIAPFSATKNKNNICPGISVGLGLNGGALGTNATWRWYTGSCAGTLVGTGATLTVSPSVTTTYYVRAEGDCNTTSCVTVTVFISCDIDKDKDGIPDFVESNMALAFTDANSNGIINAYDPTYAGFVDANNDYINDNFQADGDSDKDGIPNYLDNDFSGRIDNNGDGIDDRFDADLDGIINMLDRDSDNDGIPDVVEAYGVDANGDGLIDNFTDTDGDGLSQNVDINNTGASNTGQGLGRMDLDGDGYPNYIDLDSDNDGIPDLVEAEGADINNNAMVDVFIDANSDGFADAYTGTVNALLKTGADMNNDGKADIFPFKNMDGDAKSNPYDRDSDGDGLTDLMESGLPDDDLNGIVDGTIGTNGWSTVVSGMGTLINRNSDSDSNYDYLDIDSDNDGITDNIEGQTTMSHKVPTTTDTDGDGLANIYDQLPSGFGGPGIFPVDTDLDTVPDYLDSDTDSDGQIDRIEGNDFNFNKMPDDLVTLTGIDTDGDGLDDRFDNDNSSPKVTSAYMGTNGAFTNPGIPGTRTVVQRSFVTQSDRDWRYVGNVLPIQFIKFSGVPQNNTVLLNWTIIADRAVDRFEIERSLDNITYVKAGTVKEPVALQVQQNFSFTDNISTISNEVIYYRLKVIGKAGEIKNSNILVIRRTQVKVPITIMPNPANNYVSIRFSSDKEGEVTIRLIDNIGKLVMMQKQKALKGINTIQLNGLAKYSNGIYNLQVLVNDDIVSEKLVLAK